MTACDKEFILMVPGAYGSMTMCIALFAMAFYGINYGWYTRHQAELAGAECRLISYALEEGNHTYQNCDCTHKDSRGHCTSHQCTTYQLPFANAYAVFAVNASTSTIARVLAGGGDRISATDALSAAEAAYFPINGSRPCWYNAENIQFWDYSQDIAGQRRNIMILVWVVVGCCAACLCSGLLVCGDNCVTAYQHGYLFADNSVDGHGFRITVRRNMHGGLKSRQSRFDGLLHGESTCYTSTPSRTTWHFRGVALPNPEHFRVLETKRLLDVSLGPPISRLVMQYADTDPVQDVPVNLVRFL